MVGMIKMVVPVNVKGSKASNYYIDLVYTFGFGACTTFYLPKKCFESRPAIHV